MLAKKYPSRIVSITKQLEEIFTVEFESLRWRYRYYPGQFLHLAIDETYDGVGQWPESRCFSMQSNPDEENIRITYAVKGKFTTQMEETMEEGDKVWLKLPYGDLFTQDHNKEKTVFLAGGTGITPFLSLFTHESFREYKNPKIYLGFRSKKHHIYQDELTNAKNQSKMVEVYFENHDGLIDIDRVFKKNGVSSDYFISGPPDMISGFKKALIERGVSEGSVLTDEWE
ncbi:MAG: FAD-dependent oxidoreductase [Candidatus Marinimicrobia bacterium]|nr:FAD-dependent oxidoreductase [Candidatus Neomarinimicrobiota bacterium]MCF7828745.1 FAD-dependent oxidoreductase [Candidatus Neomarinimicrobiota bacterium]MCF7880662.1 FAD-dependent oxidoreductase [Candidatus Neomarinimicrobiota bacterium]